TRPFSQPPSGHFAGVIVGKAIRDERIRSNAGRAHARQPPALPRENSDYHQRPRPDREGIRRCGRCLEKMEAAYFLIETDVATPARCGPHFLTPCVERSSIGMDGGLDPAARAIVTFLLAAPKGRPPGRELRLDPLGTIGVRRADYDSSAGHRAWDG